MVQDRLAPAAQTVPGQGVLCFKMFQSSATGLCPIRWDDAACKMFPFRSKKVPGILHAFCFVYACGDVTVSSNNADLHLHNLPYAAGERNTTAKESFPGEYAHLAHRGWAVGSWLPRFSRCCRARHYKGGCHRRVPVFPGEQEESRPRGERTTGAGGEAGQHNDGPRAVPLR